MRRQVGRFFPAVMIAMWVQIVAPIGASWTMAAALDSFGSSPICSPSSTDKSKQTDQGRTQQHRNCCDLCIDSQSGSAPLAPFAPIVAVTLNLPAQIAWHDLRDNLIADPRGSPAQARAPPSIS